MSLLSRLRGSKGYEACGDAASPRADQAGPEPRAISASISIERPAKPVSLLTKKGGPFFKVRQYRVSASVDAKG